eukprot:CAMPEP_0182896588 /NCGR_PEP_ID=MMETSP0034_2-20130328/26367_1 /TAXON_ID=156128 /ORGANISM="Nephroselmis pyriformis, Strain CCMP717" /LENGTH=118 /DNA_ID=CAMNT_0025030459 /DNA_START=482 /DNA_END=834 /DNA_ORIENTATION=+
MSTIHKEAKTLSKIRVDTEDLDTIEDIEETPDIDLNETNKVSDTKSSSQSKTSDEITSKQLDATQMYLGEIGFSPLLTAEEEVKFSREALRGNEKSRERMIVSNLRLVVKIARRYNNR